ncbi:MAG TPA: 5'/3'-nucleotidase SurE [Armatimonadetes bacterium]|nr:5'/3'-nucleotidase SurE [Armatimonadota bacterium]
MSQPLRILVSNDDGIDAPGLRALVRALCEVGEVAVVAPDRERSAVSHAITMTDPLRAVPREIEGCRGWAVSGMPADCVLLGARELLPAPPDIVASGINRGANLGEDVWYSGTVSAAVQGGLLGVPSVAFSVANLDFEPIDYRAAAAWAQRLVPVAARYLSADVVLNINVPNRPPEEVTELQVCRQGRREYRTTFERRTDPRGGAYYWLGADLPLDPAIPGGDVTALRAGKVTVVPVRLDLTATAALEPLRGWLEEGLE